MLAKLTSKNQLTLPKSVTEAIGPVQYFEVQVQAGQILLSPVRIQRGDAVRAKLAELAIDEASVAAALQAARQIAPAKKTVKSARMPVKPAASKTARPAAKTRSPRVRSGAKASAR